MSAQTSPSRRNGLRRRPALAALAATLWLAGCASPAPQSQAPDAATLQQAGVPPQLPAAAGAPAETPALAWRQVVQSPRLVRWVGLALANNRDLRVAMLHAPRAQAQLGLADANRAPAIGAGLTASGAPNSRGDQANSLSAGLQLSAWEIDLFGRLAKLSEAARAQLLASEAGRRAAELSLVAAVLQAGLALLPGQPVPVAAASPQGMVPTEFASAGPRLADEAWLAEVPAGLSSSVLLARPDVIAAEQAMRAAQANIAAARAALWPAITLTAQAGQASAQLAGLFAGGNFAYTLAASAVATVFDGGRRQAGVDGAVASQQIALAQYERSLQAALRETADALAGLATWREQLAAQTALRDGARETARLTELKASQGAASALERLDAQRALWAAEQAVVQVRLGELVNRVALFKALGR